MCLPQKQFKQKIALPSSHRCRKEGSKKNPQKTKLLQKGKYEYVNEMKNQHQSHCRLVEHIHQADFALKTCKQADESQRGWSRPVDLPRKRMRAGGFCRGRFHGSSGIPWVAVYRCCDGNLNETQTPQPHEQRCVMRGKCCALVFMKRTMSGKVSTDEQADTDPILKRQNCTGSSKPSLIPLSSPWTALYCSINGSVNPAKQPGSGPRQGKQVKKEQKCQSALPAEINSLSLTSHQAKLSWRDDDEEEEETLGWAWQPPVGAYSLSCPHWVELIAVSVVQVQTGAPCWPRAAHALRCSEATAAPSAEPWLLPELIKDPSWVWTCSWIIQEEKWAPEQANRGINKWPWADALCHLRRDHCRLLIPYTGILKRLK